MMISDSKKAFEFLEKCKEKCKDDDPWGRKWIPMIVLKDVDANEMVAIRKVLERNGIPRKRIGITMDNNDPDWRMSFRIEFDPGSTLFESYPLKRRNEPSHIIGIDPAILSRGDKLAKINKFRKANKKTIRKCCFDWMIGEQNYCPLSHCPECLRIFTEQRVKEFRAYAGLCKEIGQYPYCDIMKETNDEPKKTPTSVFPDYDPAIDKPVSTYGEAGKRIDKFREDRKNDLNRKCCFDWIEGLPEGVYLKLWENCPKCGEMFQLKTIHEIMEYMEDCKRYGCSSRDGLHITET